MERDFNQFPLNSNSPFLPQQIIYPKEDTGEYDDIVAEIVKMADLEEALTSHGLKSVKFW
jgi:hypothetical protein